MYSEETLTRYYMPVSETEEDRIINAKNMIKDAINNNDDLKFFDYEIFEQGSFANNTNIRMDSDIDICVMLKSTFFTMYPEGCTSATYGFTDGGISYSSYRDMIINALKNKFNSDIKEGNKSIKINSNSYRVKADVVVAYQYRNYKLVNSCDKNRYIEGIKFISSNQKEIVNYPKQHIQNGIKKNKNTNFEYKKIVRILKNIKNDMDNVGIVNIDTISSFLIESLVWNIPDSKFGLYDNWNDTIKNMIYYLWNNINYNWKEVNNIIPLFSIDKKWSISLVKDFLLKTWNYMEFK